ncbi:hypothetical protein [Cutibacterium sp.]|uniref:hypothetical protein n=1 Tax=Cutibacterium sp. TaxID=1912221 RepID=UPI0026DAC6DF|nr:hypothetical protein [Cutibacterium sp.]MDO4412741.1 hypothetical protein [Cutibacterium sp.]
MKVFRFFLGRIFLRKPVLVAVLLALIFGCDYIIFMTTRAVVSTYEGASEVATLNAPGTFIANLDPDSTFDVDKISKNAIGNIYDRINEKYTFALFTDGYIIELPNKRNVEVPVAYMNQKYSELNGFELASGAGMNFEYDLKSSDAIPVLVGKGLADDYPLNSTLSIVDPALNKKVRYVVTGILERDQAHSNLYALDSKQYYNFSVIVPVNNSFIERAEIAFKINGLMDLAVIDTTRSEVHQLGDYINKTISVKLNFFSQEENIEFYHQYFKSSMVILCVIMAALVVFIFLLAVWNSIAGMRVMVREFTVNLLVGMSYGRFRRLLFGYYLMLSLVAFFAVFGMVLYSRQSSWHSGDASFMTYGLVGGVIEMDCIALMVTFLANFIMTLSLARFVVWRIKRVPISVGVLQ